MPPTAKSCSSRGPLGYGAASVSSPVYVTRHDSVTLIGLARPEKRNAMNADMAVDLDRALDQLGEARALVLTGDEVAFSAGADLSGMGPGAPPPEVSWQDLLPRIAGLPIPTLAAIEGWCLGGGLELAMTFDLRIAAETATFGLPEVTRGIYPGGGGTQRLPRLVGPARAKELMFTGKHIDAATAERWGLVNELVPAGTARQRALVLAGELARGATLAISLIKGLIDDGIELGIGDALALERERGKLLHGSEDAREGVQAFVEKRPARFTGR